MERLTQKDDAGYKLVMKSATECIGEDTDIKEWSVSRSAKGTQTIRGYAVDKLAQYEDREEGCEPKYLGENTAIGCRNGECKCGNIVKSYQKYCDECGIKLEWGNVRAQ